MPITELGARRGRTAATTLLGLAAVWLSGCQNIQNSSPPQTMVRVIDASYNAPPVDVNIGITPIAVNVGASTFTNYAFLPPENAPAYVFPTETTTATASVAGAFLVAQQHSVFITDTSSGYQATLLTDQAAIPPAGYVSLRFLQQAVRTGALDIYLIPSDGTLAGAKPLLSRMTTGTVSGYVNVQAGNYTLAIAPAGDTNAKDLFTSEALQFTAEQVRSVLIMDAELTTSPPVTIAIGDDLN
ncbi:MAG TPA: DUF4397 domain-containing protein [Acidobacteriaceae bacterium]|nr:DUF4397 domain-containing protein [Acidobacteriaceae bacterium]